MSVSLMAEVWKLDIPTSPKMVLLALADCANDGGSCWPSMATIATKASMSLRTAQGSIKALCDGGFLLRDERPGKGCFYTVLPRRNCTPATSAPPQKSTRTPADSADKPSRTIIGDKAKASSPQRGAAKRDANGDERAKRKSEKAAARALWVKPDFADTDELADVWADFLINRETKNLPWTETAYRGQLRKIDELAQQLGQPPGDVLRECVEQGWGGVHDFTERRNGGSQRARDNRTGRRGSSGGGFSGAGGRVDGFGAGLREAGTSLADAAAGDASFGG